MDPEQNFDSIFGDLSESPESERYRLFNKEKEDYGRLDTDRTVQAFKASLRVLLHCERLANSGKAEETEIIDKCSYALNNFVELHYDKRHLQDVIRRQREEIEKLKTKDRDTTTVNLALTKVNTYYDAQIGDFTKKCNEEATSNVNREKRIENLKKTRENTIDSTKRSEKEHVCILQQKRANCAKEIADMKQAIQDEAANKKKLIAEFEETKRNTAGLKMALENARNKLSDAIDVEDPGVTPPETPQVPKTPSGPKFDESMFQPTDLSK